MMSGPALELAKGVQSALRGYFADRATGFGVTNLVDNPSHLRFSVLFEVYDYLPLIFTYDRGSFAVAVDYGRRSVAIQPDDGVWAPFDQFDLVLTQIDREARLRIPEKYLEAKGW